jgi:hypothetical protein
VAVHTQLPPVQVLSASQVLPHEPQLKRSFDVSTQPLPHAISFASHLQMPSRHVLPPGHPL